MELGAESVTDLVVVCVDMHVGDDALAVGVGGHGKKEAGTEQIGELQACMVVAVAEDRHLDHAAVGVSSGLEHLGEGGVRHIRVLGLVPAVQDHHSGGLLPGEATLEASGQLLNGGGLDRPSIHRRTDGFHIDTSDQAGLMRLQEFEALFKEAQRMTADVASAFTHMTAQIGPFDLDVDQVEELHVRQAQTWKESFFEAEPLQREPFQAGAVQNEAADANQMLHGRVRRWQSPGAA